MDDDPEDLGGNRTISVRLDPIDEDALNILKAYIQMQPWFEGKANDSKAVRYALRMQVAAIKQAELDQAAARRRGRRQPKGA